MRADGERLDPLRLPLVMAALDHPLRLRVIAALRPGRQYVSALARELRISRRCSTCTWRSWRRPVW